MVASSNRSVSSPGRTAPAGRFAAATATVAMLAGVAGVANVLLQIAYPLVHGESRRLVTIWSVAAFAAFSHLHALATRGWRAAVALFVVFAGGGWVAEAIGSRGPLPFGNYEYSSTLGWQVLGVPVVVALAWSMMGWLALLAGRRVARNWWGRAGFGAAILTAWDLMLDPQMVRSGHWSWQRTPGPWLHGIPLVNSVGWFAVAFLLLVILDRLVPLDALSTVSATDSAPKRALIPSRDLAAWLMLLWTWFSETLGHLVFFGSPTVGLVGGLVLGVVLVPWVSAVTVDLRPLMKRLQGLLR